MVLWARQADGGHDPRSAARGHSSEYSWSTRARSWAHVVNKLAWLRLSDFHFKADGDLFSQDLMCRVLTEDVKSRLSEHGGLTFVLVSGEHSLLRQGGRVRTGPHLLSPTCGETVRLRERFFSCRVTTTLTEVFTTLLGAGALQVLASEQDISHRAW